MKVLRRLFVRRGARSAAFAAADDGADAFEALPPLQCAPADVDRWNDEWIEYLRREWYIQLVPHSAHPSRPPLPDSALETLRLEQSPGRPWELYCDADDLSGRRVMEMGCGCGNLGKFVGGYAASYLGTDYSTLALQVARLVSPANCTYVHVADGAAQEPFVGAIDTVVSRYFWIHQNARLAGFNLDFLARFLRPGGRLYADFYWPDPNQEQGLVFDPDHPLSRAFPSATFRYSSDEVRRLLHGRPLRLVREEVVASTQRRYVVLERT